jgi:uncharacterized protein YdbL (DUF1318 family)
MPKHFDFRPRRRSESMRSVNFFPSYHSVPAAPLLSISLLTAAFLLPGCTPTVNLATPDPVKVDIAVRLDVYQKTAPTKVKDEQSSLEIAANRRLRSGEIQQLKNNAIVGEDRDGYLDLRKPPSDPKYLQYAQGIISDENADRAYLYLSNAQAQNKPLEMVESDYAQLWSDRAFPGEWIQKENGSWIQK